MVTNGGALIDQGSTYSLDYEKQNSRQQPESKQQTLTSLPTLSLQSQDSGVLEFCLGFAP